ncbi:unnamed protein product [Sphagnum jensenii]|uniref:Arf-GAP domain-containing protein n=1 Tax=Sphagnum jensenii TaxID=128206 RepID=A0ABP1B5Z2_9BRYO
MGSRMKEDERHEMVIRKLLKMPQNKRCINCDSVGPQYVCTNFSIFVCTQCSGVHREFTHRIKSISMAKFTPAEVTSLQAGGNERGREIYLKEYDMARNSLPDSSNPEKLRNFIKHVYVERRFTGERPPPTPSKGRQGERGDAYDSRQPEQRMDFGADRRSPSYENHKDDRRFADRSGTRKSDVERSRYEEKRSPGRFEQERRPARRSYEDEGRREERRASDSSRDRPKSDEQFTFRAVEGIPPPVRSLKDILGEDVSLHIDQGHSNARAQTPTQSLAPPKDARSHSLGFLGNEEAPAPAPAHKRVVSASLIDFSGEPEPAATTTPALDLFAPPATTATMDPFSSAANGTLGDPFQPSKPNTAVSVAFPPASDPPSGPFQPNAAVADLFAPASTVKPVSDPFSLGVQASNVSFSNIGVSAFDLAATTAPPNGYPDIFASSTANGSTQWATAGWTPSTGAADAWSAFQAQPSAALSTASPVTQQLNMLASVSTPAPPSTQGGLQQLQPGPLESQTFAASGGTRQRREIPQDFFTPAARIEPGVETQQGLQSSAFEQMGAQLAAGQQSNGLPPRTRNPFDDDSPPTPFSLGTLQAALPQVEMQWGQPLPPYQPPANQGGYGYSNHLPTAGPAGAIYGGSPFLYQTAGSNPFG